MACRYYPGRRPTLLPDILHYDRTRPAHYPNGRTPTHDVRRSSQNMTRRSVPIWGASAASREGGGERGRRFYGHRQRRIVRGLAALGALVATLTLGGVEEDDQWDHEDADR